MGECLFFPCCKLVLTANRNLLPIPLFYSMLGREEGKKTWVDMEWHGCEEGWMREAKASEQGRKK